MYTKEGDNMQLKQINTEVYENWICQFDGRNFLQSSYEGEKMKKDGWDVRYIAGMKENTIQVCALVAIKPLMKLFHYAYIPRGPFYTDFNVLNEYYSLLKKYLKKENCVYLETDPYIPLRQRDKDGQIVSDGWNHLEVVDQYKEMGFAHLPLKQGYDMSKQCRWMSVLYLMDQTKEQVFKSFPSKTRQNIKNSLKYNIKVRKLERDELSILHDLVSMTGERRHFSSLSLEYYQEQYDYFKDKAQAYYAYLDIDAYVDNICQSIEKEKEVIQQAKLHLQENPHSKNSQNRLHTATLHLESLYKRQEEAKLLQKEHGHQLGLAAAMYIFYGKEVVYLMSGSNDAYKKFKAPYALQWTMIQKAIEQGYTEYNFYGISGLFEPDQEGYGVFDFKRGFNAVVVELVGNFILPIHPVLFDVYKKKNHLEI